MGNGIDIGIAIAFPLLPTHSYVAPVFGSTAGA